MQFAEWEYIIQLTSRILMIAPEAQKAADAAAQLLREKYARMNPAKNTLA